ncbi:MAG: tetratricopeptide repeat protein, partial [Blastocatellia bacterium]|nr:tetratricopeptide repeat protein [Blastocatellia bacterium]
HMAIGLADLKLGRNEEAVRAFQRAIELDPNFAPTYAYLGITRVLVGQSEEGARCFEQALQRSPGVAVVHYLLADALLKQPDASVTRIEKSLKRAIELDADYAPPRLALGKLYVREGRLPEAVAGFEEVIKIAPNLAEAYYQLGRALNRLERTAEANTALNAYRRLSDMQKQEEQDEQRDVMRRLADVVF